MSLNVEAGFPKQQKRSFAQFTLFWKIPWARFDALSTTNHEKFFITSYNNVSLHWSTELSGLSPDTESTKFRFFLYYKDGPLPLLEGVCYQIKIMNSGAKVLNIGKYASEVEFKRGSGRGWVNFDDKNSGSLRFKYGLNSAVPLTFMVTLKIPTSVFAFNLRSPLVDADFHFSINIQPTWVFNLFQCIEDSEKSSFWDCKLISRDGHPFYCHQVVLGYQSEVLTAMFRHPRDATSGALKGEYDFPTLSTKALRVLLAYLYTSQTTLSNLSATTTILEVADAAEQYGLKSLKDSCAARFWKIATAKPEDCFEVLRFSDLHDDMKYVKYRAMDVLAENYESFGLHTDEAIEKLGKGEQGQRLRMELNLYLGRRIEPSLCQEGE